MSKYVVWDQGGVIFRSHLAPRENKYAQYLSKKYGVSIEDYKEAYRDKKKAFNGGFTLLEAEQQFLDRLEIDMSPDEAFHKRIEIEGIPGIYPEILELMWEIDKAGCRNSYLTNGSVLYLSMLEYLGEIPKLYSGIASDSVGVVKPDPKIYVLLENSLNTDVREDLFLIDDLSDNIQVAAYRGWRAHLFIGNNKLTSVTRDFIS